MLSKIHKLMDVLHRLCKSEISQEALMRNIKRRERHNRYRAILSIQKFLKKNPRITNTLVYKDLDKKVLYPSRESEVERALNELETSGWITRDHGSNHGGIIYTIHPTEMFLECLPFQKRKLQRPKNKAAVLRAIKKLILETWFVGSYKLSLETTNQAVYERVPFLKTSEIDSILRDFQDRGLIEVTHDYGNTYIFRITDKFDRSDSQFC